jgi:putative SOS response-associated peptidase YedK
MCGRFTSMMTWPELHYVLGGELTGDAALLKKRFNIAPTQAINAVIEVDGAYRLGAMYWGVQPEWASRPIINATAEKYLSSGKNWWASFRRCVIPASGFYEWKRGEGRAQPMYIRLLEGEPFVFAGLYRVEPEESGAPKGKVVIVTTAPNALVAPVHNRMPAILRAEYVRAWLDSKTPREALADALEPFPAEQMEQWPVSTAVNSVAAEGEALIEVVTGE